MTLRIRFELAVRRAFVCTCWLVTLLPVPDRTLAQDRELVAGISTSRPVPGHPYELAGKRIAFTNWYYIQPGDLDWRDEAGKSVYVTGDEGPYGAQHVGLRAPRGIRIAAEPPQVPEPFERPYRMILRDGDLYKGWTSSEYFESTDGYAWEKQADLKFEGKFDDGVFQVFVDSGADPEERYKSVMVAEIGAEEFARYRSARPGDWEPKALLHFNETGRVSCLRGAVSADGIYWRLIEEPLVVEYCDTWNTAYYDAELRKYVIYTRQWSVGARTREIPAEANSGWTGIGRRAIGRTASSDFQKFAPSEMVLEPALEMLPSEQLYTNCYTSVPGAPDQHLMFPTIWNGSIDDSTRIALATSHDGRLWNWVPGGDLLRTQAFGAWNGGCIWATPNLVELPNGDWALPYLAHNFPHKYPRGQVEGRTSYAIWPKGRLVGVEANDTGEFTMVPLIAAGKKLKINATTARTGFVKVEVVGDDERQLDDCDALVGDRFWQSVTWNGRAALGVEVGRPVTLRIVMQQAKLYGIEFE